MLSTPCMMKNDNWLQNENVYFIHIYTWSILLMTYLQASPMLIRVFPFFLFFMGIVSICMLVVPCIMKNDIWLQNENVCFIQIYIRSILLMTYLQASPVLIRIFLFSFFLGYCNYMHVGCNMNNEEWLVLQNENVCFIQIYSWSTPRMTCLHDIPSDDQSFSFFVFLSFWVL